MDVKKSTDLEQVEKVEFYSFLKIFSDLVIYANPSKLYTQSLGFLDIG